MTFSARTLLKNASANIVAGMGAAALLLVLPPLFARYLSKDEYGVWALALQVSAYANFVIVPISTGISRQIAESRAKEDPRECSVIVSTASAMFATCALIVAACVLVVAYFFPVIFRSIPGPYTRPAQLCTLLVGLSNCVLVAVSVLPALFVGFERNEIPAICSLGTRFALIPSAILVLAAGGRIVALSLSFAVLNVIQAVVLYVAYRSTHLPVEIKSDLVSTRMAKILIVYASGLSAWAVAMVLIAGLDTTIVGIFDFPSLAYYSVALSLTMFIAGIQNAAFSAFVPAATKVHALGSAGEMGRLLITSTKYGMLLLFATSVPLLLFGRQILSVWVGRGYAEHAAPILVVLVLANIVRLSTAPYAALLMAAAQHNMVIATPLAEGVLNVVLSVIAVQRFGAIGVAEGTLLAAMFSVAMNLFYNMPRTTRISYEMSQYVRDGLIPPIRSLVPVAITYIVITMTRPSVLASSMAYTMSLAMGAAIAYRLVWKAR